jgi:hypothetical protein
MRVIRLARLGAPRSTVNRVDHSQVAGAQSERFPVWKMWICKPVGGRRGAEWQVS